MDNSELLEIRNNLAMLPVLQERLYKLNNDIILAEQNIQALMKKYREESLDVEHLQKDSLSATILKFIGKYDNKVTKEMEEMYLAKMEYDNANERVRELYNNRDELTKRINELKEEKNCYETELQNRISLLKKNLTSQASIKYSQLEAEQDSLSGQQAEITEALTAANKVTSTLTSAIQHLDSAESWATFDVWTRGGIFNHMAKYEHIDEAQSICNRLDSQLKDLRKELDDVNYTGNIGFTGIDSTTRAIDFWFDNIFTDLSVRSRIREDNERLRDMENQVYDIIHRLKSSGTEINKRIQDIEAIKNELVISL
ncbi:MAG: hypothetical protein Q8920_16365 [Bacillota bacterium]|nr:hypothetical protein [Bacillota bacterium]